MPVAGLAKSATCIDGFDEITGGGIPRGRVTLLLGEPGAGKTVFALETLVNGATKNREPGIFVAFEESSKQLITNAATFGWDLEALQREQLFFLDARLSPAIMQAGDFDLAGMLVAITAKAKAMNAKRVVFDGLDVLLSLLADPTAERREMYRIYEWLQAEGLTGLITAKATEADRPSTERYAFMQFMVDCVVLFQHRLADRVSIRTVRILKYRGSAFAENEFPLIISRDGIHVSTFAAQSLHAPASTERISTGIARLDTMLGGGYYRGSSVLISGAPGTAKTTLTASCAAAACERGEMVIITSFDEGGAQYVRNLRSIGVDLQKYVDAGTLIFNSLRTEAQGAEEHLLRLTKMIDEHKPTVLVIDPISALMKTGGQVAASHASIRIMDYSKARGITTLCTSLVSSDDAQTESTATQISTIADTWIHLAYLVKGGERNRTLTVVKSRGTRHSSQVRELVLSDQGVSLADVYSAGGEVLVGTARFEREAEEEERDRRAVVESKRRRAQIELAEAEVAARIAALQRELEGHRLELQDAGEEDDQRQRRRTAETAEVMHRRRADGGDDDDTDDGRTPGRDR
ncbi:MAG: circadian clock protein KaiC [Gemmatimonadaceae bacterium]|nr:circadian clock protein KaiC [Gemmatimonadaceae bacterium]